MAYGTALAVIVLWFLVQACEPASTASSMSNGPPKNGTSSDPNQACPPAHWYDICWFYFANFIIHALSVRSLPGEDGITSFVFKLSCFLAPFTGARRGISAILRSDILVVDELEAAVESSATCMIVRTAEWKPRKGDKISGCKMGFNEISSEKVKKVGSFSSDTTQNSTLSNSTTIENPGNYLHVKSLYKARKPETFWRSAYIFLLQSWRDRERPVEQLIITNCRTEIQGTYYLPEGYALAVIPNDVKIWPLNTGRKIENVKAAKTRLSSTYNMPRVLFAITQTILGVWTVYNARGPQFNTFGYAAFAFTVIPYAAMSIVSLLGGLLSREYEDLFLVHSEIMDEMISRGGIADGTIGTVCPPKDREGFALEESQFQYEEEKKHGELSLQFGAIQPGAESEVSEEFATECHPEGSPAGQDYTLTYLGPRKRLVRETFFEPPWKDYPFKPRPVPSRFPDGATIFSIPSHTPMVRRKPRTERRYMEMLSFILLCALIIAPYVVIYALSGFRAEQSTGSQQSFTMTWLVWGLLNGFLTSETEQYGIRHFNYGIIAFVFVCYGSNAVGGMVMVAQEMMQIGACDQLNL